MAAGAIAITIIHVAGLPLAVEKPARLDVAAGASVRQIAQGLHERGILARPRTFELYARLSGQARRIQAGTYVIEPGASMRAVLRRLVDGRVHRRKLAFDP